jgi:dTDP-glucose 4,6-dehydratase
MDWKNKHVLITGASGFIGSHLAEALVNEGADVTGTYTHTQKTENKTYLEDLQKKKQNFKIIHCDILKKEDCEKIVQDQEYIFHLAAEQDVRDSVIHPEKTINTNAGGTLNILLAANEAHKKNKISRIIIVSTANVYGKPKYNPIDEEHPLFARSPYAASKIAAEKYAESFAVSYNLLITTVRFFNIFGPRQTAQTVIPETINQALNSETVTLKGNIHATRDFTYITELIEALLLITTTDKTIGETINIGSGKDITIKELAEKIITLTNKKTGKKAKLVTTTQNDAANPAEIDRLCANVKKLEKLTGKKINTDLTEGIDKTIDWMITRQKNQKAI